MTENDLDKPKPESFRMIVYGERLIEDQEVLEELFVRTMAKSGGTPVYPLNLTIERVWLSDPNAWIVGGYGYRD